jgi:predicted anti-sigma-YlaC factor YlaD
VEKLQNCQECRNTYKLDHDGCDVVRTRVPTDLEMEQRQDCWDRVNAELTSCQRRYGC